MWSLCIRTLTMVSNALEKSTKAAKVTSLLFIAHSMLSRSLIRVVNVECFFLYPCSQQTFQLRFNVVFRLVWSRTTWNQCWNNTEYVKGEIYNIEQCRINVVYFNVDLNIVSKRRNNTVIFNVDLKQRCGYDHLKEMKFKPRVKNKIIVLSFKEHAGLKIFTLFSILRGICKRRFGESQNS